MKPFDRLLQHWRIAKAAPYIPRGARVLDVGCLDGVLFERLGERIREGVGIDAELPQPLARGSYRLLRGMFPDDLPKDLPPFDAITLLAVLEHVPEPEYGRFAKACWDVLKPGGVVVVTVPSPLVDRIVHVLQRVGVMEGTDCEHHHGFAVGQTPHIFAQFRLIRRARFQFGLNNLFVFSKAKSP